MQGGGQVFFLFWGQILVFELKMGVGEIGFDWVCFLEPEGDFIFIILYKI